MKIYSTITIILFSVGTLLSVSGCAKLTGWMIGSESEDSNKHTVIYRGQTLPGEEVHIVDTPEITDPNSQAVKCYTTEEDADGTLRLLPWDDNTVFAQNRL